MLTNRGQVQRCFRSYLEVFVQKHPIYILITDYEFVLLISYLTNVSISNASDEVMHVKYEKLSSGAKHEVIFFIFS